MNLYRIEAQDGRAALVPVKTPKTKGVSEPLHIAGEAARREGASVLLIDITADGLARVRGVVNHHGEFGLTLHETDYTSKVPNGAGDDA